LEFSKIYESCLAAINFTYTDSESNTQYKLISDLLMINDNFRKILLPTKLIELLLSFTHLLGHKGIDRMLADMESYHFPNKYSVTKRFIRCCYACFLSHKSSRKSKLGIYPIPSAPMEEVCVDIAESLNTINGYSHLLITQCALPDFIIITPLSVRLATEPGGRTGPRRSSPPQPTLCVYTLCV